MTAPIARIIDRYSQTVTPWVRVEYTDGRQETMSPTDEAVLEFSRAARIEAEADIEFPYGEFGMPFADNEPYIPDYVTEDWCKAVAAQALADAEWWAEMGGER